MDKHEGVYLVETARKVIEQWVKTGRKLKPANPPSGSREKRGVFTSLHTYPDNELRGCIGYPEPIMPLIEALVESAISATRDPRFQRLSRDELKHVTVEVSVLTEPKLIKVKHSRDILSMIEIGKDGLIIERGACRGLLLPQVPVELHWDQETFLGHLCVKASLSADKWLVHGTKIYKFQADVFAEEYPRGSIKRVEKGKGKT
jgi:uncharacterized protein (TIGR00296 family)